jgi:hypothetical protein
MVDIPLISQQWKDKKNQEELEALMQASQESGYSKAMEDQEEENLFIKDRPIPEDDKQFWAGTVFKVSDVHNAGIFKKVLPSIAMSYYHNTISLEHEIRPYKNRLIYMKLGFVEKWIEASTKLKEKANTEPMKLLYDDAVEVLQAYMALLLAKVDVDSRSRLSDDGFGLKEVNTKRGKIERSQGEKKPMDERLGVRA